MRLTALFGMIALAAPLQAQAPGASAAYPGSAGQVEVTSRVIVVDREALSRAGLTYAVVGNDRVRVSSNGRRSPRGVRIEVGTHGVRAFLEAARESRWIRSESTQRVLAMSGSPAVVSSTNLAMDRHAARTQGPSMSVIPTVLPDGSILLQIATGHQDRVTYAWGYGVDGSPAAVDTEVIARDGQELILASSSATRTTTERGLLSWGSGEQGRDVLVAVSARVIAP